MYSSKLFITALACLMSLFVMIVTHVADAQDKITDPWLWMIAPTAPGLGDALSTDVDSLAVTSGGSVTEAHIAANGADEGDTVGNFAWTLAEINNTGDPYHIGNVNDVVNRIGWAIGNVDDYSSYALITVESAIDQRVPILSKSGSTVKWSITIL